MDQKFPVGKTFEPFEMCFERNHSSGQRFSKQTLLFDLFNLIKKIGISVRSQLDIISICVFVSPKWQTSIPLC